MLDTRTAPIFIADLMLKSDHSVLVYQQSVEDFAHEVMEQVVDQLERRISVSDPTLDSLVVLDTADHQPVWNEYHPTTGVISLREVVKQPQIIHPHQIVVTIGAPFLEIDLNVPLSKVRGSYSALPFTPVTKELVERVIPFNQALFLGEES